jgi:hypothetical protein
MRRGDAARKTCKAQAGLDSFIVSPWTKQQAHAAWRAEARHGSDGGAVPSHRAQLYYGSFARTFALPPTVDAGKVSAEYKAGVLTVRLPLREEAKPTQIKVQIAA